MAQPATALQSRTLIRSAAFSTPQIFVGVLGAGLSKTFAFDVASGLSDRNLVPNALEAKASGYFLDASVFSDQAGTLDVQFVIGSGGAAFRSAMPAGTPVVINASTLGLIAGLRVVGTSVEVIYTNTAGVDANIEFTAIARSL